jgi:hypothetical protein
MVPILLLFWFCVLVDVDDDVCWDLSLGQLIKIVRETQMEYVVDKLIDFTGGKDEELRDISSLGLSPFFSSAYNLVLNY